MGPIRPVQVISPAPRDVWEAVLATSPEAWPSQTPTWLDCICTAGGYEDASYLYEMPGNRYLVLPMARRRLPWPGLSVVESMPHGWGIGGVIGAERISADDISAVWEDLASRSLVSVSIRPNPMHSETWASAQPRGVMITTNSTHVLDLHGGSEQVWSKRFRPETRTKIRKAERIGLKIECDSSPKLVPVFYDLYLKWIERRAREQGMPLGLARWRGKRWDPYCRIHSVVESLGEATRTWVAWYDGRPAAAMITLFYKDSAIFWRGTSDKELARITRANDLLQWLAIQDACRAGCQYYNMGESGGVASLMRFKSGFGAIPYPYVDYNLSRLPITQIAGYFQRIIALAKELLRRRVKKLRAGAS